MVCVQTRKSLPKGIFDEMKILRYTLLVPMLMLPRLGRSHPMRIASHPKPLAQLQQSLFPSQSHPCSNFQSVHLCLLLSPCDIPTKTTGIIPLSSLTHKSLFMHRSLPDGTYSFACSSASSLPMIPAKDSKMLSRHNT